MKTTGLLILVCVPALFAGCGRESNAPPPTATPATAPASPRGPVPGSGTPAAAASIPDGGDTSATLRQLTQALRDYVVHTRSVPKDFEEFAAKSKVSFPPPPAGRKYAIQRQAVVLVNR